MNLGFFNRKALLILAVVLIVLVVGGAVSSKWQASIFKSLNKNVMEATVAPESFYFEDSQNQLQQSLSQIGELGQDEISPAEPVQENENMPSKSEIPLTMEEIQDRVDDIAEQIDIVAEEVKKLALSDADEPDNQEDADQDSDDDSDGQNQVLANLVSGGGTSIFYPKILISEAQIDLNQRFIELYNPTSEVVNLTGWYIQRKTKNALSWGSLVSSPNFEGKLIQPLGYFLIARASASVPDILVSDLTLSEDNAIALKNPNQDMSDKVGWGLAPEYEGIAAQNPLLGKSLGRKWVTAYQDTDNNLADFEAQTPTPKAQNSQAPLPNPFPDTNNDKKINVLDLILIRNHLGSNDPLFDANNDGAVDIKDLEYVRNNLNRAPSAPAAQNEENMASDGSVLEPENAEVPLENEVILNGPVDEPLENTAAEVRRSEDAIAEEETPEPADVSQPSESESAAEVEAVNSEQNNVAAEAPVNSQNEGVVSESLPADLPAQQPGQQNDSPTQQP